jgi:hypothetical protein
MFLSGKVAFSAMEKEMVKKCILPVILVFILYISAQQVFAQDPAEDGFVIEDERQEEFLVEEEGFVIDEKTQEVLQAEEQIQIEEEGIFGKYILADVLNPSDIEPAIKFYIHSEINRKFAGLITNLKLEKIYGIVQNNNLATVYFDYSYTSVRNRDNIILDKGKMSFLKFNSGKWFNEELSIYLMDKYQAFPGLILEQRQPPGQ